MWFSKRSDAIDELWLWFTANRRRLEAEEPDLDAHRLLSEHLKRIDRGLTYEMAPAWEIAISADGCPELMELVEQIVSKAPKMEGWHVVAFRQPSAEPIMISAFDSELTATNVTFSVEDERDGVADLVLYVPGLTEDTYRHLAHCSMLLLESLIGEYDVMTRLGEVDYESADEMPQDARPLTELPMLVSELRFGPTPQSGS
jgi:hypothetical protein